MPFTIFTRKAICVEITLSTIKMWDILESLNNEVQQSLDNYLLICRLFSLCGLLSFHLLAIYFFLPST